MFCVGPSLLCPSPGGAPPPPPPPPTPPSETWVSQASYTDSDWYGVAKNSSIIVAVAYGDFMTSEDNGLTWTPRSVPSNSTFWKAVFWDSTGSQFVAVGAGAGVNDVATSSDGKTWTLVSSGI